MELWCAGCLLALQLLASAPCTRGAEGGEPDLLPSAHAVLANASVVWEDADWPFEYGSMPFGNGDVSGQAWVEKETGDLLAYLSKVCVCCCAVGGCDSSIFRWQPIRPSGWDSRARSFHQHH